MRTLAGIPVETVAEVDVGRSVVLAIRPEDVALELMGVAAAPATTSVRNRWCGEVDSVTPAGPLVRVVVRLDCEPGVTPVFGGEGEVISLITRASADELQIGAGRRVTASVKATALHVLAG